MTIWEILILLIFLAAIVINILAHRQIHSLQKVLQNRHQEAPATETADEKIDTDKLANRIREQENACVAIIIIGYDKPGGLVTEVSIDVSAPKHIADRIPQMVHGVAARLRRDHPPEEPKQEASYDA